MRERKNFIGVKIEGTYGVDSVPTGGANAVPVSNLQVKPLDMALDPRDLARPYFGNSEKIVGASWKSVTFTTEIAGSGAAGTAPKWGPLLRGCGFGETIVADTSVAYQRIQSAEEAVSIYCNHDGQLHKLLGARGSVALNYAVRRRPTFDFNFMGLFAPATDAALPTIDLTGWIRPLAVNNTNTALFTLHDYAAKMLELNMQLNVEPEYRHLVGMEQVDIADHKPAGSVTIEPPTIAQKDYFTITNAGTVGQMQCTHGVAGNLVDLLCNVQLENLEFVTQGGFRYLRLGLHPVTTSTNINDDIKITAL